MATPRSTMAGIMSQYTPLGVKPLVTPINTVPKKIKQPDSMNALTKAQLDAASKGKMIDLTTKSGTSNIITPPLQPINAGAGANTNTNTGANTNTQVVTPVSPSDDAQAALLEAEKQKTISDLGIVKNQALAQIGQQQAAIAPQFDAQRAQASTQSMQQARNFAEYLAARGQSTSGIAAQAELSRGSGLTRQLGNIGQQQQAATQDVATRKSIIEQDYLGKIANATTQEQLQKLQKEYADAIKAEERTYQEGQTASDRAYTRQQLAETRTYQEGQNALKQQSDINQGQIEEIQNSATNKAIDLIRQSKIMVKTPAKPEIRNPFNDFVMIEAVPEQEGLKIVSPSEVLASLIKNAEKFRFDYGDKNYEKLLKEARLMANPAIQKDLSSFYAT
jgi:hypothetical protein